MGFLDQLNNLSPEQNQGLLAAAAQMLQQSGPSRMPTSFGQILGGGLQAYQGGMDAATKRKLEDLLGQQTTQMNAYKLRDAESDYKNQEMMRQRAQQIQAGIGGLGSLNAPAPQPQVQAQSVGAAPAQASMPGLSASAPTPSSSRTSQTEKYAQRLLDEAAVYSQYGDSEGADKRYQAAIKLLPQVQNIEPAKDPTTGKLVNVITFKDGSQKVSEFGVKPDFKVLDLGGKQAITDLNQASSGQSFAKTVSPGELLSASTTRRGQDMTDARARDANQIAVGLKNETRDQKIKDENLAKQGQVASFDTMLGTLDRLKTHPGLSRSVGLYSKTPTIPGSDSANFQAELETFKSQAFIPAVAQLKGMGALSDAEGKKLSAAVGALDPSMSETAFKQSVDRITSEMNAARNRVMNSSRPAAQQGMQQQKRSAIPGQVQDGYRFKGGDPSKQENWEKQ